MVREKDWVIREEKEKEIQKYRNKIADLLRISKKSHHQQFFETNKKTKNFYGTEFATSYILKRLTMKTVLVPY